MHREYTCRWRAERRTNKGTTTIFAALDVSTCLVVGQCKARYRYQEVLSFLQHSDCHIPADLDIHLAIDNYVTHEYSTVRVWLAQRPHYHVHYKPTYSSWLSQE